MANNTEQLTANFEKRFGHSPNYFMAITMDEVEKAAEQGYPPFVVVVLDGNGKIIHVDHDRVKELGDPTAHAEINAIRQLCRERNQLKLPDTTFITSSEPCVTCMSAMIKAHVDTVVFGARTENTASCPIPAENIVKLANHKPILIADIMSTEMLEQRNRLLSKT
jgi:tRNA(Arg) A34 adenosine deaminase TadA